MKKLTFLTTIICAVVLNGNYIFAANVNITFKVDMNNIDASAGIYVGSDWAGWSFELFQQLTDNDHDGIYEVTLAIPSGNSYNYRYTIGNTSWDKFETLAGTSCGYGPKEEDRNIVVPDHDSVLNVVCFGACTDCASVPKSYLLLSVDMSDEVVSADGVHVAGSFNGWNTSSTELSYNGTNNDYEALVQVSPSTTYEYKFLNGKEWGTEEHVFGTCEFRSNRLATSAVDTIIVPKVKFGYCNGNSDEISDTKIACIGNSITHGYGTSDMYTKCWPFQLRDLLGDGYYAENLGVSGRTMSKSGDMPWWNEPQYNYAFELNPDIIVIMLGTNDSKSQNWNAVNYKTDYLELIDEFTASLADPVIYIVTPPKAYSSGWGISDNVIHNELIPILREIADERAVNLIDMYNATSNMSSEFPDGIHPNDAGAAVIAVKVKDAILTEKPVVSVSNESTASAENDAYQWFINGTSIPGANRKTILATDNGSYQVAVKPYSDKDDIYLSEPFEVSAESNSTALTTNVDVEVSMVNDNKLNDFTIYPNPAKEIIHISNAANSSIIVYNTLGEQVYTQKCNSSNYSIDTTGFSRGWYVIKVLNDQISVVQNILLY